MAEREKLRRVVIESTVDTRASVNAFIVIQWFGTGPDPSSLGEILRAITKDIATTEKNWTRLSVSGVYYRLR